MEDYLKNKALKKKDGRENDPEERFTLYFSDV